MERVAYLGPKGSYSELAAKIMCPDAARVPYATFRQAVNALLKGDCAFCVLPIENSINGTVTENIDLLQSTENVTAFKEYSLPLDHRIATLRGADLSGISSIYSHEQPLAQCENYLFKHFPKACLIAMPSTTASLEMVKSRKDAAIVGAHIIREGITLSPHNIADFPNNHTSFLAVKKGETDICARSNKILFSVTCRHRAGALCEILEYIRAGGVNMTKIQSRPIKDRAGEYRFFIETEGDYSSAEVRALLEKVKENSLSFKVLGAY